MIRFASIGSLASLAFALAIGCSSSDAATPATDAGADGAVADGGIPIPPTATCSGDATSCVSGTMTLDGFTAKFNAAKVELYREFPGGNAKPIASQALALDGKFAFSNVVPWTHYYVRGVVGFGDATAGTGAGVATVHGRFAVPLAAGTTFDLTVIPVQLELLETMVGTTRGLSFVSAHVFDPATGHDLTDATVTFLGTSTPTSMPYVTNASGSKSYFVELNPPVAAPGAFTITTSHPAFGASPKSWDMTPEASLFSAAAAPTSPMDGATVPSNQPLVVTWPMQASSDYTIVELFTNKSGAFSGTYSSAGSIASDVVTETIPAASIATPGAYLLNVDIYQAACRLGTARGCTYLSHPATANLTAQ